MDIPRELQAFRAALALLEEGLPLIQAFETVALETGLDAYRDAARRLGEGAPAVDVLPGLPAPFRPIVRWGEREGLLSEAMAHASKFWLQPGDLGLPIYYLRRALQTQRVADAVRDGREVFEIDPDWKSLAAQLETGAGWRSASRGKPRILPPPIDAILTRAEESRFVPELLDQIWAGLQEGMFGGDTARSRATVLQQAFYAWSLMLVAGATLAESIAPLLPSIPDVEVRATFERVRPDDFAASLGGVITPVMIALLRKAHDAGDLSRALRRLANELRRGTLAPR